MNFDYLQVSVSGSLSFTSSGKLVGLGRVHGGQRRQVCESSGRNVKGRVYMVAKSEKPKFSPLPKDPLPDDGAFLPIDIIDEDEIGPSKDPRRRERKRRKNEKPIGYREYIKKIRSCYKTWKKHRGTYGIQELLVKLSYGLNVDWRNSMNVKALRRKFRAWRARGGAPSEDEYKEAVKMVTDATITQEQIELGHRVVEALQSVKTWQRTEKMPDLESLREILIDLAHCGAFKEMRQVIKEMLRQDREVDAEMFFCLIHACVLGDHMEGAAATLKRMKARKTIPTVYMYNYIIRAWSYSRELRFSRLTRTFEIEMKNRKIEPNIESYEVIFDGYAKTNNLNDAPRTWETMRRRRVDPSVECYNGYMDCHAGRGDVLACKSLWNEMTQRGLEPNANSYGVLIRAYANAGEFDDAREIEREMMEDRGFRPTLKSHNAMICAHAKIGDMEGSIARFKELRNSAVTPSLETYGLLVAGYAESGDVERAIAVYRHVLDRGMKPNLAMYNAVLSALALAGRYEEAKKFILKFRKGRRVTPDDYSLKHLIDACANAGFLGGAKDAFHTTQMILRLRPVLLTWNAMLRACALCDDLEATELFFKKLKRNKRSRENSESYNWLVVAYARARRFQEMDTTLDTMVRAGFSRNLESSKAMVKAFRVVDDLERGAEAFEEMMRQRIPPDAEICNEMIEMFLEHEELERALSVFVDMQQVDVPPDTRTYNALIKVQTERRAMVEVLAVHEEMKLRKVKPDTETYCNRIAAFGAFGDLYNAVGVFLECEVEDAVVPANTRIYAALINAHAINNALSGAVETFARMRKRGLKPDSVSYTALIDAYSRCGDGVSAVRAFREMEHLNLPLSESSYATVVKAHGRMKDLPNARRFYEELLLAQVRETTEVINSLIFVHCEVGNPDEALALLRRLQEREQVPNLKPDTESFELVLTALCNAGRVEEAEELFEEMITRQRLKPSREAFVAIIGGYAARGDVASIRARVEEMRRYDRVIAEEPYAALIAAHSHAGDLASAEAVLEEQRENGVEPGRLSCRELVRAYSKQGRVDEALKHFEKMNEGEEQKEGMTPIECIYEDLLGAFLHAGRHEELNQLFERMRDDARVQVTLHALGLLLRSKRESVAHDEVESVFAGISKPDVNCWNEVLKSRTERGHWGEVMSGFITMQTQNVVADSESYRILTSAHHSADDVDGVVWSLRKWGESGAEMDAEFIEGVISATHELQGKLPARQVWKEASRWMPTASMKFEENLGEITEEERLLEMASRLEEEAMAEKGIEIEREMLEASS
uniref:PROP1-like PPR domain-containing protein n=1 Tax=Rhodosorus marinus TaxID=101924 RepID=A0A7S3EHP2_9RHOD|mmetsp:Transcript_36782/g.147115  ORF Transcript_36782/g.147115 Transcript_36782/m.147115 type:complete len:1289 (+) Transcript_36782:339-4205(+)